MHLLLLLSVPLLATTAHHRPVTVFDQQTLCKLHQLSTSATTVPKPAQVQTKSFPRWQPCMPADFPTPVCHRCDSVFASVHCCCADLARRLRAAADGLDYQENLSDEDDEEDDSDAEISELEEDVDAHPPAAFAEDGKLSHPEQAPEEAGHVTNSLEGHPWGAEVGTCPFWLNPEGHAYGPMYTLVGNNIAHT